MRGPRSSGGPGGPGRSPSTSTATGGAFVPSWRSLSGLVCLYEAAQESGVSNGASLATITDRSGAGVDMTAASHKATYSAAGFLGKPAYALSGSQYETTTTAILAGQTANCSIVWVGSFADANARAAFTFGIGSGFAFSCNIAGGNLREVFYGGVGVNTSDAQTTNPELWIFTYSAAAGTKGHFYVNNVAKTLAMPNMVVGDPVTGSVFGGLVGGADAINGYTALLLATSNVISAGTISQIATDAQASWPGIF